LSIQKEERDILKEATKDTILNQIRIAREQSKARAKERERDD